MEKCSDQNSDMLFCSSRLSSIERSLEYSKYLLACSDQSPSTLAKTSPASANKSRSIHQKLHDLYIEEAMKVPEIKDLEYASNLLAKLTKRERLNCMVLSLYPGNEGYSIMLRSKSGVESETMKLPYEESEILEYIDEEQLPPFLLDLLEKAQMNVFYSGCVIVEVRDYRRSATGSHDTQFVLLRPSPQSLLRDITAMSCDGHTWTQEDLFHLESELILATEEPLCLDPSPAVMFVENTVQFEEKFLNDPALKRSVKRYTQSSLNRKRKLAQAPAPKGMHLYDFITKKKEKNKTSATSSLSKKLVIDGFKHKPQFQLSTPESVDVKKFAKIPTPASNDGMIFVEEHIIERDPMLERHMMVKITIYQPQLGDNYIGEFYLDHDYTQGRTGEEGRRCRFILGSRHCVDRYLQQFKDLFTEQGKLQVKISVLKANEAAPTVQYTQMIPQVQTIPNLAPATIAINNTQTVIKQVAAANPQLVKAGDMGTVASMAAKRNIPIQLSLSLTPACSLSTTPGVFAQANAAGIPQTLSAQLIASTVPSGTANITTQRIKGPATISNQQRPSSSPLVSSAITPKVTAPQQHNLSTPTLMAIPKVPTPTPAQTPPPNARTPTPTLTGVARRSSATEQQTIGQQQQVQQNLASFLQGLTAGAGKIQDGQQQQSQQQTTSGITNISISNLSNLPPNINIQGLTGIPGVNIANLSGLQQVSMAQIAVPITMINNNPSILQAQSGLLVTSSSTSGTNTATFVTMVTALQASNTSTPTTSMSMSSQMPSSSGSGVLSFPVGLSQLMPITSKTGGQGLRGSAMPVLQLQNQQIQLVSLQQQRGQVKSGTLATASSQQGVTRLAQGTTSTVPLSTVLTGQQMTALAVGSKPGQAGSTTITAQQLIQLTGGVGATLSQGASQLATHVAFQKGQAGGSKTLQFHSLQLKPSVPTTIAQAQGTANKGKSKKRTTPTPPK